MMTQAETYVWVSDAEASDYSATLTGNPLLFRETRLLLALIAGGLNDEETAARIVDQNLFQYRSTKSITKRVNALISRFAGVPSDIRAFIVDAPLSEARLVLILVLAVRDRLFREFVQEVVLPAAISHDSRITKAAAERFFDGKSMTSPRVAGWSPQARTKLRTVFMAALVESGLLMVRGRDHAVRFPVLTPQTRELLQRFFPPQYHALLGGMS